MLADILPLVEAGFAIHLLHPRSKRPIGNEWAKAPVATFKDLKNRYRDGMNVGVRLGKPSRTDDGYLHVIDLDVRVAEEANSAWKTLEKLFPRVNFDRFPQVQSGSRGESRHFYFVTDDPFPSKNVANSGKKYTDADGKQHWTWEIEVFGTGKQVALPPSIHPDTGKTYRWIEEIDLEIGIPAIKADLIADLVYGEGEKRDDRDPDSMEPLGLNFGETEAALEDIRDWADDHETWRNVGMALKHEFGQDGWALFDRWSRGGKGYDKSDNLAQWRAFKVKHSNPITMRTIMQAAREASLFNEIDDLDEAADGPEVTQGAPRKPKSGDPDMTLLQQSRIDAPAFPIDIFGKRLGQEIARHAHNAASPVDFVAAAVLCGASSVIGNSVRVQVKPGFVQAPILWGQIIGPPSSKKSPALRVVTSILNKIEGRYEPFYIQAMQKWERAAQVAEIKLKAWEGKTKAMVAEGKEVPEEAPADCQIPPEPNRRQFMLNDLTIEAFMRAQVRNPRGFMVFRDELAGWLGNMERYSAESERGAWLESYDGGSYAIERVKDGNKTIRVRAMCAPVLGGIQPERLLTITAQSAVDDGLQARFLPFWPEAKIIPMSEGQEDDTWLTDLFQKLSELIMDKDDNGNPVPFVVKMKRDAFAAFRAWSDARDKDEAHTPSRLGDAFGKATGQVARVALILEYLWWASKPDFDDEDPPQHVSVEAVKAAIKFRDSYLSVMQRRVYSHAIEVEEVTNARRIAEWIIDQGIEKLNARTVRRKAGIKGINGRTPTDAVDAAMAVLTSMGWLMTEDKDREGRGGRPSKTFTVNPRLWELLDG